MKRRSAPVEQEKKPPWAVVPKDVKAAVNAILGRRVARGIRAWGSYGPGPTFRLRLADGSGVFVKAVWEESSEVQREMFTNELRVYRELDSVISPWAPGYIGEVQVSDWHVLVLEDLGPKSAPPWSRPDMRSVARGLAEFHRSTTEKSLPGWVPELTIHDQTVMSGMWRGAPGEDAINKLANLSKDSESALRWLEQHSNTLVEATRRLPTIDGPRSLLHLDVRSDNVRVVNGKLRLFDWPFVLKGPPEIDIAVFAQTVEAEGFFDCEQVLNAYAETRPVRREAVDASVVAVAGVFASRAFLPEVPGLPRLRSWQRKQLKVVLRWAAARLQLPEPKWLESIKP